jgi:hypothetical protein
MTSSNRNERTMREGKQKISEANLAEGEDG